MIEPTRVGVETRGTCAITNVDENMNTEEHKQIGGISKCYYLCTCIVLAYDLDGNSRVEARWLETNPKLMCRKR